LGYNWFFFLWKPSFVESEDDINLYYIEKGQIEIILDLPEDRNPKRIGIQTVKVSRN